MEQFTVYADLKFKNFFNIVDAKSYAQKFKENKQKYYIEILDNNGNPVYVSCSR